MDRLQEKTTVPYPPVGPGGGQSLSQKPNQSIAEDFDEHKPSEKDLEKMLRQLQRTSAPDYLPSLSMNDLYERVFPGRPPIIEGLLYPGVYLFVGAPKVGKSFLMAQLAYHVSKGLPLWGYEVRQGAVLYLALEDDYPRLQGRLYRMFGEDSAADLHLSIYAKQLNSGLEEQLNRFVREHPDTRLIIIDTLQKIREAGAEKYSYADDYKVITSLKHLADGTGICLLLVHHTRKQQADDKFDMISGTNGLLGSADGAFLLYKENRTSTAAVLDVSGRDQQDQKLYLIRNTETLLWDLQKAETELWKEPPEPLLDEIAELVRKDNPYWEGSPTALVTLINVDIQPHVITRKLNVLAGRLYAEHGILFRSERVHEGRKLRLWKDNTENV